MLQRGIVVMDVNSCKYNLRKGDLFGHGCDE